MSEERQVCRLRLDKPVELEISGIGLEVRWRPVTGFEDVRAGTVWKQAARKPCGGAIAYAMRAAGSYWASIPVPNALQVAKKWARRTGAEWPPAAG